MIRDLLGYWSDKADNVNMLFSGSGYGHFPDNLNAIMQNVVN